MNLSDQAEKGAPSKHQEWDNESSTTCLSFILFFSCCYHLLFYTLSVPLNCTLTTASVWRGLLCLCCLRRGRYVRERERQRRPLIFLTAPQSPQHNSTLNTIEQGAQHKCSEQFPLRALSCERTQATPPLSDPQEAMAARLEPLCQTVLRDGGVVRKLEAASKKPLPYRMRTAHGFFTEGR